jgi:hypothetical protein
VAEGVPTHVRHLEIARGESDDAAAQDTEAFDAGRFLTGLEEELVAEANAEVGLTGSSPVADGFPQAGGAKIFGAMCESPNARNNDRVES